MEEYLIQSIGLLAGVGDGGGNNGGDNNNPRPVIPCADAKSGKSQQQTTAANDNSCQPPASYLDAYDLGHLACVSRAVSKRCGEDDIVGGVMRSQWPGAAKLHVDPSLLMMVPTAPHASAVSAVTGSGAGNDDASVEEGSDADQSGDKKEPASGSLWLFRHMASRLVPRNATCNAGDDEDEDEKDDGGQQDKVNPSNNKRRKIASEDSCWKPSNSPLQHCLGLFNVYDDATRRAIISHVLIGQDDLGEFMESSGDLAFALPVPVVLPHTKLRLSTDKYQYGNFELAPGQEENPNYSVSFDLFDLGSCSRLGGFILDTSRPENIKTKDVKIVQAISGNPLVCDEQKLMDETFDWESQPAFGRYVVFSPNGPRLRERMHRRVRSAVGGRPYKVCVRAELKTQCPSKSARHIGMNHVLDSCWDEFAQEEDVFLAALESTDMFWWEGENDPDLKHFFDMAQKELSDADEPFASVVKVEVSVHIIVAGYCKRFEDIGITPRELVESLMYIEK